tara:strand:+ start:156 stop:317 length:162 start_codon:yes stop_codon:yes gene_type:complete
MLNKQKQIKMTQAQEQYRETLSQKWFKTSYENLTPFGKDEVDNEMACAFQHLS